MSFFIQDLHLNFHSFLGFQHGSDSSVKAIMLLLPLVIGLKCFWFLIALLLYPKSTILWLSFLDPKDLCLPNQFSKAFCQHILNLMSNNKLGSFNDWINAYFQSFICLLPHDTNIFWPASLSKFSWRFWTEFSQSWNNLKKTLRSHENLWSLTLVCIQIQETGYFECLWCQKSIH